MVRLGAVSVGTTMWRHRGETHLTAAVKSSYRIGESGALEAESAEPLFPIDVPGRHALEVAPLLPRAEVHLHTSQTEVFRLAVYRDQAELASKSATAAAFLPIAAQDPRRCQAMKSIKGRVIREIPDDFDWASMQAVSEEQQLDSFTGSEWVVVGATGEQEALRFGLPGMVASLKAYGDTAPVFPTPCLDMVLVDLDAMRCSLVWRAHVVVTDATTVFTLVVAGAVVAQGQSFELPHALDKASIEKRSPLPEGGAQPPRSEPAPQPETMSATLGATMASVPSDRGPALPFAGDSGGGGEEKPPVQVRGVMGAPWEGCSDTRGADAALLDDDPNLSTMVMGYDPGVTARSAMMVSPETPELAPSTSSAPEMSELSASTSAASETFELPPTPEGDEPELGKTWTDDNVAGRASEDEPPMPFKSSAPMAPTSPSRPPGTPAATPFEDSAMPVASPPPATAYRASPPRRWPRAMAKPATTGHVADRPSPATELASTPLSAPDAVPAAAVLPAAVPPASVPSAAEPIANPAAHAAVAAELAREAEAIERDAEERRAEHQREMKTLREESEAASEADRALREAEEQRERQKDLEKQQRQREDAHRAEQAQRQGRQTALEKERNRAQKLRDMMYGFKSK